MNPEADYGRFKFLPKTKIGNVSFKEEDFETLSNEDEFVNLVEFVSDFFYSIGYQNIETDEFGFTKEADEFIDDVIIDLEYRGNYIDYSGITIVRKFKSLSKILVQIYEGKQNFSLNVKNDLGSFGSILNDASLGLINSIDEEVSIENFKSLSNEIIETYKSDIDKINSTYSNESSLLSYLESVGKEIQDRIPLYDECLNILKMKHGL